MQASMFSASRQENRLADKRAGGPQLTPVADQLQQQLDLVHE